MITAVDKTVFVKDLLANMPVKQPFLVVRKDLRSGERGTYLLVTLADCTGEVNGIQWNFAEPTSRGFDEGDVALATGTVSTYQGQLQIRLESLKKCPADSVHLSDYVQTIDNPDEVLAKLRAMLDTVQDPHLRCLNEAFTSDETFMARFVQAPAGKRWHHALVGGLLLHTYEVASICDRVTELYPEANRDIVLTAAFLHDIGKVFELQAGSVRDYTIEARLIGHIVLGTQMVLDKIRKIDGFPEETRLHMEHAVLSHQGEHEQQSPVVPKTLEACIVYHADNLDAQANAFLQIRRRTEDRDEQWSEYIALIGRQLWTGKMPPE